MNQKILDTFNEWLNNKSLSNEERKELENIKNNEKEIEDRFYKNLVFGTGGLRGVEEVGTNRMNRFVIRRATQGLANYLLKRKDINSVAIGYDSRNNSEKYSRETAAVLASNGIKVYLYKELMPTPALSFAVRYFKCDAGVMITASHNPKQYNGYKVYGNDGCQCTLDMANAIYEEIEKIDFFNDIKLYDISILFEKGMIEYISEDVFNAYMKSTLKESIYQEERKIKIVYTPLNGAGRRCITTVLKLDGFNNVSVVKEQEMPDGNFTTCPYPNPEIHEALTLGIEQLKREKADVLIASDPDSDRIGCVVRKGDEVKILTGNEVGLLLLDALISVKPRTKKAPVVVKTIVSTDMANIMASKYGIEVREVLTGFKFIGEQIHLLEENNEKERYLFGFEESCGYLTNTDVRDKDAVNAALLLMEVANHLILEGRTLLDRLNEIYEEFGDYKTSLLTFEYQGVEGQEKIKRIMEAFREKTTQDKLAGLKEYGDYLEGMIHGKNVRPTNLPKSDVMKFFLEDGETITIRPSGTEPKLKAYIFAYGDNRLNKLVNLVNDIINNI